MKKIYWIILAVVLAVIMIFLYMTKKATACEIKECVEVKAPSPITYESGNTIKITYKWFEGPQGTWTLYFDADPRGGHELWRAVRNFDKIVENTCTQPEPEPEPTPIVPQELTPASAPVCPDGSILDLPIAFKVVRQGDKATLTWYKTGGNLVNIYYKEVEMSNWTHAVGDVPNVDPSNSYVIGGLKPALGYTFAIEQHNGCAGGKLAQSVVVDGPAYLPVTFTFSYWIWSK